MPYGENVYIRKGQRPNKTIKYTKTSRPSAEDNPEHRDFAEYRSGVRKKEREINSIGLREFLLK